MPIEIEIFIQLLVLIYLSLPILALSSQSQGKYLHLDFSMLLKAREYLDLSRACSVGRFCFSFSGVNEFSQAPDLINGSEPLYLYCCSPPDPTFILFLFTSQGRQKKSFFFFNEGGSQQATLGQARSQSEMFGILKFTRSNSSILNAKTEKCVRI